MLNSNASIAVCNLLAVLIELIAMTKRRPLEPEELATAARAKQLWLAKKDREKISQEVAADALGFTASAFNQYINGKIAINTDALFSLAAYLGVTPADLDPNWRERMYSSESFGVSDVAAEFSALRRDMGDAEAIEALRDIAGSVSGKDAARIAKFFLDRAVAEL